jgi:uncharacterized protein involved in copper resistance
VYAKRAARPRLRPLGRDALRRGARHRLGDHAVGAERQVRAVRLDRAERQHGDGARAIEVAHLFPRHLGQLVNGHSGAFVRRGVSRQR